MTAVRSGRSSVDLRVRLVIGIVCVSAGCALALSFAQGRVPDSGTFGLMLLLTAVAWAVGSTPMGGSNVSFISVLLLAAAVILGPAGAGLLGALTALGARERQPWRARIYNMGMHSHIAVSGAAAYLLVGGVVPRLGDGGVFLLTRVALPLLAATAAQVVVNVLLIVLITRVSYQVPIRVQVQRMLPSTVTTYVAYGVIAFVLVVLWLPVGVGGLSVILIIAPLLGARWAFLQYVEERANQERSLQLLVAAIETRVPHLQGHAARVADLCAAMGESLGFTAREVKDLRRAGMLHDVDLLTVDPDTSTSQDATAGAMLADLPYLHGARELLTHGPSAPGGGRPAPQGSAAEVVALADQFDLLITGATGVPPMSPTEALDELSAGGASAKALGALARIAGRPSVPVSSA